MDENAKMFLICLVGIIFGLIIFILIGQRKKIKKYFERDSIENLLIDESYENGFFTHFLATNKIVFIILDSK